MTRLARAIEAIADRDSKLIEESTQVDQLRAHAAAALHELCRTFVEKVNGRLKDGAVLLDPASFEEESYVDGPNLFQINLRGRLLQIEFAPTDQLYENDDFKRPYVLRGTVRSFNQDLLQHNNVDEQLIFFCPDSGGADWYYFDERTYRTGRLGEDYLITEMERLL